MGLTYNTNIKSNKKDEGDSELNMKESTIENEDEMNKNTINSNASPVLIII